MIYYQGKLYSLTDNKLGANRALFFGENPFTSGRLNKNGPQALDLHLNRLDQMLQYFYGESLGEKAVEIERILNAQKENYNYFRINLFKDDFSEVEFSILFKNIDLSIGEIHLGVSRYPKGKSIIPSFVKLGNYVQVFRELEEAKEQGINELVMIDQGHKILECSTSNLFFVKDQKIYTPKLKNGILEGITRARLLKFLRERSIKVEIGDFDISTLEYVDEIWLTNAVKGLRRVHTFHSRKLGEETYLKIGDEFNSYE